MLIQWCLKGIQERPGQFADAEAQAVLNGVGIWSSWLRTNAANAMQLFSSSSHLALSSIALSDHVLSFHIVGQNTPFISLSAGCVEIDPTNFGRTITHSALETALDFATASSTTSGYVFRLWVPLSPKPAPELPHLAEELRDLNFFPSLSAFHDEGEIAAKLFIPARQIEYVEKFDQNLRSLWRSANPDFVKPETISNLIEVL